jgi:hypothetical protein
MAIRFAGNCRRTYPCSDAIARHALFDYAHGLIEDTPHAALDLNCLRSRKTYLPGSLMMTDSKENAYSI